MNSIVRSFRNLTVTLWRLLQCNKSPHELSELQLAFDFNHSPCEKLGQSSNSLSLLDSIIGDGFLWAVPKNRRSVERRATLRMGYGKMLVPKKNVVVCSACGHFHLAHTVCGNCYEMVKKETEVMQEAIQAGIKLNPIEKDVVVLYEDDPRDDKIVEGKRIVELPKKRPAWFSKSLLSKDSGTRKPTTAVGEHFKQPILKDN